MPPTSDHMAESLLAVTVGLPEPGRRAERRVTSPVALRPGTGMVGMALKRAPPVPGATSPERRRRFKPLPLSFQ